MLKPHITLLLLLAGALILAMACRTADTLTHLGAAPTNTRVRVQRTPTRRVTRPPAKTQAPRNTPTAIRAATDVAKPTNTVLAPTNAPTNAPTKRPTVAATHPPAAPSPTKDTGDDSSP